MTLACACTGIVGQAVQHGWCLLCSRRVTAQGDGHADDCSVPLVERALRRASAQAARS